MALNYYDYPLSELPWRIAEQAFKETDLAIIPLGSVETYGHLPQGTDGIAAEAMSATLARKLKAIRTPLMPVGYTPTLAAFPGTLSIDKSALEESLRGVCQSLVKFGIKRIFVVNGHAGNNEAVNTVIRELNEQGVKGATIQVWFFARSHDKGLFENYNPHGHASEAGTSVMLYLRPELVDMKEASRHQPAPNQYPDITVAPNSRVAMPDGMHGDALAATAEKGKELYDRMVNRICQFIENWH
jgi:creatinine amidohydrolase